MSDTKKQTRTEEVNEVPAINENAEITWDELIVMYDNIKNALRSAVDTLEASRKSFEDIILGNEDLIIQYNGAAKAIENIAKDLVEVLKQHSKQVNDENGNVTYQPYRGKVDVDDEKSQQLYISLVLAYNGVYDNLSAIVDNSIAHLLGLINEEATKKEQVKNVIGNKETVKTEE